jgi:hypothetical protein
MAMERIGRVCWQHFIRRLYQERSCRNCTSRSTNRFAGERILDAALIWLVVQVPHDRLIICIRQPFFVNMPTTTCHPC